MKKKKRAQLLVTMKKQKREVLWQLFVVNGGVSFAKELDENRMNKLLESRRHPSCY